MFPITFKPNHQILLKNFHQTLWNQQILNSPNFRNRNYSCKPKICQDKIAFVTGGSRGIGLSIADKFLEEGCKAVVIASRNAENCEKATVTLNKKHGNDKCWFQPVDVTNKVEFSQMFHCIKQKFGKIDILVNNSGILKECAWEDTIKINIMGLVQGTLLGFEHMSFQNGGQGGVIINVASVVGLEPIIPAPVYSGTKHFIVGFTRCMGNEFYCQQTGVKVMAVCPGVTSTDMVFKSKEGGMPQFAGMGESLEKVLCSMPPQEPEEVGKCCLLMLKKSINGSIWVSEGGECYKVCIPSRESLKPKPPVCPCSPPKPKPPCPPKEPKPPAPPCPPKEPKPPAPPCPPEEPKPPAPPCPPKKPKPPAPPCPPEEPKPPAPPCPPKKPKITLCSCLPKKPKPKSEQPKQAPASEQPKQASASEQPKQASASEQPEQASPSEKHKQAAPPDKSKSSKPPSPGKPKPKSKPKPPPCCTPQDPCSPTDPTKKKSKDSKKHAAKDNDSDDSDHDEK